MGWENGGEEKREDEEGGRDGDGRDGDAEAPCGFIVGRAVCVSLSRLGNSQTFGAVKSRRTSPEVRERLICAWGYRTRIEL